MKLFKWLDGRQMHTKYHKWCFLYFKIFNIGIDGYILRYEPETILPIHKDKLETSENKSRHYRLNVLLKGKTSFWCPSTIFKYRNRVIFFRPDKFYHSLTVYTKTYKLSFGLAIYKTKI